MRTGPRWLWWWFALKAWRLRRRDGGRVNWRVVRLKGEDIAVAAPWSHILQEIRERKGIFKGETNE